MLELSDIWASNKLVPTSIIQATIINAQKCECIKVSVINSGISTNTVSKIGSSRVASLITSNKASNYIKYCSYLERLFGVDATQDRSSLVINKVGLPNMQALATSSAESLFTALLLQIEFHDSNSLLSDITVKRWRTQLVNGKKLSTLVVSFYELIPVEKDAASKEYEKIIRINQQLKGTNQV